MTHFDFIKASGPDCFPVVVLKNCEPELSHLLADLCTSPAPGTVITTGVYIQLN